MTMPTLTPRLILALGLIVLAVLVLSFGPAACRKWQSERAQGRVSAEQAKAASDSAKDAISTVSEAGKRETASEELTRDNERSIREAEGAGERVNMGAHSAGLKALCRRQAYASDPRCSPFRKDAK